MSAEEYAAWAEMERIRASAQGTGVAMTLEQRKHLTSAAIVLGFQLAGMIVDFITQQVSSGSVSVPTTYVSLVMGALGALAVWVRNREQAAERNAQQPLPVPPQP